MSAPERDEAGVKAVAEALWAHLHMALPASTTEVQVTEFAHRLARHLTASPALTNLITAAEQRGREQVAALGSSETGAAETDDEEAT